MRARFWAPKRVVPAALDQSFQFTVTVPGSVKAELHGLDRTLGTIHVQPWAQLC